MQSIRISAKTFEDFAKSFKDPLLTNFKEYLSWMRRMSILKTFWCSEWRSLGYLGLKRSGGLIGVLRLLRVKIVFHGHGAWRGLRERGRSKTYFSPDGRRITCKTSSQELRKRSQDMG